MSRRGADRVVRLVHVITDLDVGGAEAVLADLVERSTHRSAVVSLAPSGPVAARIEAAGIPVRSLDLTVRRPSPAALRRLTDLVRSWEAEVVQTWMYHANVLGGIVGRWLGLPVVWGIHQTDLPAGDIAATTRLVARTGSWLAGRIPDRIICCAESARAAHVAAGYPPRRTVVIENGFAIAPVRPDEGDDVRDALGIPRDAPVIGRIGRFHPQKDYPSLLAALHRVRGRHPDLHVVMAGRDVVPGNPAFAPLTREGAGSSTHLLGPRPDVPRLHAAMDVAVSSSAFGEAFPLVIGEAMERGVPVVATDVGDSRRMVGGTGLVVPPRDPDALADALLSLLDEGRERLRARGAAARRRIADLFSIETMVQRYDDVHREVVRAPRRG